MNWEVVYEDGTVDWVDAPDEAGARAEAVRQADEDGHTGAGRGVASVRHSRPVKLVRRGGGYPFAPA